MKQSSTLGRLNYENDYNQYVTTLVHNNSKISLHINCEAEDQIERLLPFAEKIWKGRIRHFKAFREHAVSNLLEPLNQYLYSAEEGQPKLSANQLRQILKVPFSITFFLDGNDQDVLKFEISGGDDDRLCKHCVTAYFDETGKVALGEVVPLF